MGAAVLVAAAWAGPLAAQVTERASVASGGVEGNLNSFQASVSADSRFVTFVSLASNLVAGDVSGHPDVFVHDRQSGTTERVSVSTGGAEGNAPSYSPSISADGRFVAFYSGASNLIASDTNFSTDIFVRDRQSGTTERVSVATGGAQAEASSSFPSISADGRFVAFHSGAANLTVGDSNLRTDIFVRDRQSASTDLVSVATGGAQGNSNSNLPAISADGRFIVFVSGATNLVTGDANGINDVFVRDCQSGTTERASVATGGAEGNASSYESSISADGRFAVFYSDATNLVTGDTNGTNDVFVRDLQSGTTERASVATGGAQGNGASFESTISADGRFVTFYSEAWNLVTGDTNGDQDIFVRDRQEGTTERVSLDTGGTQGNSASAFPSISADGRFVTFDSYATNLVAGDMNTFQDVFVRDRGQATVAAPATEAPRVPRISLLQSLPNPFNSQTTIDYALASPGSIRLSIYDASGRSVRTLVRDVIEPAGRHTVAWDGRTDDGRGLPGGVYFSRLEAGGHMALGRMTLVR